MRKEFLAVLLFVKFGYNFNDLSFIDYICEKCNKSWLKDHLKSKWNGIYENYGSHAVMNRFFVELDSDLQEALVEYAINVYAPVGMATKYKEYKSL